MIVSDFVYKYFIEEIGSLVEEHPFVAFTLMSIGIESLGKCLNANKWNDRKEKSVDTFNDAIKSYATLTKYAIIPDLYHNLRCGLAHRLMVQGHIILGPDKNNLTGSEYIIGCMEFYADFRQACLDAINNKSKMVKKNLSDEYDIEKGGHSGSTQVTTSIINI